MLGVFFESYYTAFVRCFQYSQAFFLLSTPPIPMPMTSTSRRAFPWSGTVGCCSMAADWMDTDLIAVLDAWVCAGEAPDTILASDANDQLNHRSRPLYQYPAYPVYNGEGDINKAESFHAEKK